MREVRIVDGEVVTADGYGQPGDANHPPRLPVGDDWTGEVLNMVHERLQAYLGPDVIAPMFYDDAITAVAHRAAFGKLPRGMYPEGSLLHQRDARTQSLIDAALVAEERDWYRSALLEIASGRIPGAKNCERWHIAANRFIRRARSALRRVAERADTPTADTLDHVRAAETAGGGA